MQTPFNEVSMSATIKGNSYIDTARGTSYSVTLEHSKRPTGVRIISLNIGPALCAFSMKTNEKVALGGDRTCGSRAVHD